jgi:hypothetical protein
MSTILKIESKFPREAGVFKLILFLIVMTRQFCMVLIPMTFFHHWSKRNSNKSYTHYLFGHQARVPFSISISKSHGPDDIDYDFHTKLLAALYRVPQVRFIPKKGV